MLEHEVEDVRDEMTMKWDSDIALKENAFNELESNKNNLYDEKLKLQEIIDNQIEQLEHQTKKVQDLSDDVNIRKEIIDDMTAELKTKT